MERKYVVEMTITVDDADIREGQYVTELVLETLEEAPFQVDTFIVN